jgi:hypothetical protein
MKILAIGKDVEEAKKILETLPLVKENLIEFEIIPLIPYPGFARLFTYTDTEE